MNNFKAFLFLVIGLVAGINYSSFIKGKAAHQQPTVSNAQTADAAKAESIAVEMFYQDQMDSLAQTNFSLGKQVAHTRSELQKAKHDNGVLKDLVDTLIVHAGQATDTATKLADCDSMQTTIVSLLSSSGQQDSLYESLTNSLQAEVANKDSLTKVQQQAYSALQLSFDHSLMEQDRLSLQSLQLEKQLTKMKAKNKLLSAGLFIVSGIATYSLVRH
jgi:hypothetical protein